MAAYRGKSTNRLCRSRCHQCYRRQWHRTSHRIPAILVFAIPILRLSNMMKQSQRKEGTISGPGELVQVLLGRLS